MLILVSRLRSAAHCRRSGAAGSSRLKRRKRC